MSEPKKDRKRRSGVVPKSKKKPVGEFARKYGWMKDDIAAKRLPPGNR